MNTYNVRIIETKVRLTEVNAENTDAAQKQAWTMYLDGRIIPGESEVAVTVLSRDVPND